MLDKDRFPFLILGIGIGIILTNTIYTFNPNVKYRDYSRKEIIAEATDLGMVFIKDNIDISPKEEKYLENSIDELEREDQKEKTQFIIEYGDSLEKVSMGLYELGIIGDRDKFLRFAQNKKIDKKLRVGTYMISPNLDYETIIKILTKSIE